MSLMDMFNGSNAFTPKEFSFAALAGLSGIVSLTAGEQLLSSLTNGHLWPDAPIYLAVAVVAGYGALWFNWHNIADVAPKTQ